MLESNNQNHPALVADARASDVPSSSASKRRSAAKSCLGKENDERKRDGAEQEIDCKFRPDQKHGKPHAAKRDRAREQRQHLQPGQPRRAKVVAIGGE